ncbi:MAG: hypothetical protein WBF33_12525 [Candidatus Nitrosopolaris sp.]
MSRPSYVCTVCSEHFTRKFSGKRHNFNTHGGRSEIVPYIQYMVGRSSGRYLANHPSWFRKQRQLQVNRRYPFENRVIADTASYIRPETLLQPYPLPAAYPNSQTATVQQELEELKILLGKFSSPQNAQTILELAKYNLRQGDERFLNETLEQLRTLDRYGGDLI